MIMFLDSLTNDDVEQVKEYFGNDLPDKHTFDQEIRLWKRKWSESLTATRPSTLHDALETTNKHMYPNIHTTFSILLVMPVSSATVERGNSALKYIKTSLRSSIGQSRLSNLTLMFVHKDIPLCY
ncbi:52 kDa repressor of the inhibitor of the protein kinase-like isoform X2 [Mizuhopecten yessoensis]|uniref:52 kDa repressor of the inhibitor of the protein kinase-like isoform X2 n=1 Tax=Mizuhopecten yessoensis TaxID=6573 RepID=UPI000B4594A8|nr:52 kDa repressor of the inhibitor of the protein kinase-like isoform X2 [Mizuhopecten yessoensis]